MKGADSAALLALAALATTACAVELLPDDVPIECVTICGPMVELTNVCEVDLNDALKARRRRTAPVVKRRHAKRQFRIITPEIADQLRGVGEAQPQQPAVAPAIPSSIPGFKIIPSTVGVAAPTQPAQLGTSSRLDLTPTTTPTRINPVLLSPSSTTPTATGVLNAPLPDLVTRTRTVTTQPSPSPGVQMGVATGAEDDSDGSDPNADPQTTAWPEQKAKEDVAYLEKECVCFNPSFNVARLAPLCASCIRSVGDMYSPMDFIMRECNFTAEEYQPNLDAVANNIRVVATKPVFSGVASAQPRAGSAAAGVGGETLCVVAAVVTAVISGMALIV